MLFPTRKAALAVAAALCLAFPLALAACGGGGGGGAPAKTAMEPDPRRAPGNGEPTTPTPTPAPAAPPSPAAVSGEPLEALKTIINYAINDSDSPGFIDRTAGRLYVNGDLQRGASVSDEAKTSDDERTEFPIAPNDRRKALVGADRASYRDSVTQGWLHYFLSICEDSRADHCGSDIAATLGIKSGHRAGRSSEELYNIREKIMERDYALTHYDNAWDGITTARTRDICYEGAVDATHGCSSETLGNPQSYLQPYSSDGIRYVNSDVAYLQYSAFFLNRIFEITRRHYYCPDAECARLRDEVKPYWTNIGYTLFTMGRGYEGERITGTWNGGMMAHKTSATNPCSSMGDNGSGGCNWQEANQTRPDIYLGDVTVKVSATGEHSRPEEEYSFSNISNAAGDELSAWVWYYNREGEGETLSRTFYGPNAEEVGGSFLRVLNDNENLDGVFGAKRQ